MRIFFISVILSVFLSPPLRAEPSLQAQEIHPLPPAHTFGAFFYVEPELSDAQLTYSLNSRLALDLRGLRSQHPGRLELHYAFLQLNLLLLRLQSDVAQFNIYLLPGAGMANKLSGINRFAYHAGLEADLETQSLYFNVKGSTIGARDYDQKTFVQVRGGVAPYVAEPGSLQSWVLMSARYESQAHHEVTWGPLLRFSYKNVLADFFGTFKGTIGFGLTTHI